MFFFDNPMFITISFKHRSPMIAATKRDTKIKRPRLENEQIQINGTSLILITC